MAHLNHGPGTLAPRAPEQSHVLAFFEPLDDVPSRNGSASVGPHDSPAVSTGLTVPTVPAPPASTSASASSTRPSPFTFNPAHARPPPFPVAATNGAPSPQAHPSTFEGAQGLMQMRQSVKPVTVFPPPDQFAQAQTQAQAPAHAPSPSPTPAPASVLTPAPDTIASSAPLNGFMAFAPHTQGQAASVPKSEFEPHHSAPAEHHHHHHHRPAHPTISTSSEENGGRHSDIFSIGETSDTISDPDIDPAERNVQTLPQAPFIPNHKPPQIQGIAPPVVQPAFIKTSGTNGIFPQPSFPSIVANKEGSTQTLHDNVVDHGFRPSSPISTPRRLYDPSAPILPVHGIHCHCRAVPEVFLHILDEKKTSDVNTLAKLFGACKDDLCALHLNAYARLITSGLEAIPAPSMAEQRVDEIDDPPIPTFSGSATQWTTVPVRRRRTSTPGIYEYELELPHKRRRVIQDNKHSQAYLNGDGQLHHQRGGWSAPIQPAQACRPFLDTQHNERFRRRVLAELAQNFTDKKENDWSRGETTNRYIHAILSKCQHPNSDPRKGPVDAGFLSGQEAADVIERGSERIPIFTEGQQHFQWTKQGRPIAQLFNRMEDLSREVSVQIPSHDFDVPSYETKSLIEIRDRFLGGRPSQDPWNILDLRSPLPPSILPNFLTGENCQLLPRIRDSLLEGHSAERTKASREEWNEWTDLLEWVLMSEGGHNTAPHMDSHGWSTWITIQEGQFGFGWLSRPTDQEQDDWMKDPLEYTGGNWRFVILQPGQSVFFPSGTVHFVFRLHEGQTLALGGHLLQWTALERWIRVILYQLKNPNITNEDLGMAPLKYTRSARKLVEHRVTTCRIGTMGGIGAATTFLALATVGN